MKLDEQCKVTEHCKMNKIYSFYHHHHYNLPNSSNHLATSIEQLILFDVNGSRRTTKKNKIYFLPLILSFLYYISLSPETILRFIFYEKKKHILFKNNVLVCCFIIINKEKSFPVIRKTAISFSFKSRCYQTEVSRSCSHSKNSFSTKTTKNIVNNVMRLLLLLEPSTVTHTHEF